jgi:hypothetical protein
MFKRFLLLGLLSACGDGVALRPGVYDVQITYTVDQWPVSRAGEVSSAEWEINVNEGLYTIQVVDGWSRYQGWNRGGQIIFEKFADNCSGTDVFITLHPDGRKAFVGSGHTVVAFCESNTALLTSADFTGVRQ